MESQLLQVFRGWPTHERECARARVRHMTRATGMGDAQAGVCADELASCGRARDRRIDIFLALLRLSLPDNCGRET